MKEMYLTNARLFVVLHGPRHVEAAFDWLDRTDFLSLPWGAVHSVKNETSDSYYSSSELPMNANSVWRLNTKDLRSFFIEDIPLNLGEMLKEHFKKHACGPNDLCCFAYFQSQSQIFGSSASSSGAGAGASGTAATATPAALSGGESDV